MILFIALCKSQFTQQKWHIIYESIGNFVKICLIIKTSIKKGVNNSGYHILVCCYGDVLAYKVLEFLGAKLDLLFLELVQVFLVLEARVASRNF
jgi:hypothetical protein